jgi:hypothetical protein
MTRAGALKSPERKESSMAANKTEINYKVLDNRDVVLSITFGDGQLGASTVLGAAAIVGEVKGFTVGKGEALRGNSIDVHSVLTDVNGSTNRLSATYDLTGGDHAQTVSLETIVPNEGDSDRFRVIVNFN